MLIATSRTPISTVVKGYHYFLNDKSLTGQALEASVDKLILVPQPEYLNGAATKRVCRVWDPGFEYAHGENCGLEDAVA